MITESSLLLNCHLVNIAAFEVFDIVLRVETENFCWPDIEFAVEDLPWPFTPKIQTTLNFLDISFFPDLKAESNSLTWSNFGTSMKFLI